MSAATERRTTPPPRPAPQGDGPDERQAEARFRATARQVVTQLDHAEVAASIEATMWQMLEKEPGR